MKQLFIIAVVLLSTVMLIEAKKPLNYYANKAEESIGIQRYEDALDYARQEIIDYEKNPNGYYQAALSLYALQQPGQALSMVDKAIGHAKKDKPMAVNCYLVKAGILQEMGDTIQAVKALSDGLKVDSKNVDLLIERVMMTCDSDSKSAMNDLKKTKKLAPNDPRSYIYTAYLLNTRNQYNEALEEITHAIALDNTVAYNYALRGLILKNLGRSPDWIKDCLHSTELEQEPGLGSLLLAAVETSDERVEVIKAIDESKTTSNGYYQLEANLLYVWGQYLVAGKAYEDVISLGVDDSNTYYCLADCQKRLGFPLDAYTTASLGLNKYPEDIALKYMKAQVGIDVGKGAEVLELLNSLIAESPESAELYAELGRAYLSIGQYAKACEPLYSAVVLNPSAKIKNYYGDALRLSGQLEKAASEYTDVLRMSQEDISGQGLDSQYWYAMAYSGLGNRANAVQAVNKLAESVPSADTLILPSVYARLDAKSEAIQALRDYAEKNVWNARCDLYSYNFHNLHTEKEFVDLLAEHDVRTRFNNETNLLEYVPEEINLSSGGTSMEEAIEIVGTSPHDWAEKFNKLCPIDMGVLGQITSVVFIEKDMTVVYNFTTTPGMFDYESINSNATLKKKKEDVMGLGMISENPPMADLGVTFMYKFSSRDGNGNCTFVLPPERLQELSRKSKSQDEIDRMTLELWAEESRISLPKFPSTPGATVEFDGSNFSYIVPVSESDGTFSRMELFKNDIKKQMAASFKDVTMEIKMPVFIRQNITIKHIFKGDQTGKTVEIIFTPEEIKRAIE